MRRLIAIGHRDNPRDSFAMACHHNALTVSNVPEELGETAIRISG
jgi:hypothetical protein